MGVIFWMSSEAFSADETSSVLEPILHLLMPWITPEGIEIEFFNALFVLSRSVGFTAHYLDQRRLDEGLFRLSPGDISSV